MICNFWNFSYYLWHLFLVLRSFYEERNPEDLELHGMESQPGMARYGNSQSNFAHKLVRVSDIEIHLIESFHSIHENWFPYILILIKTKYSRNLHVIQGLSVILSFGWEEVLCNSGDWPGTGRLRKHGDLVEQPIRGQQLEQSGGQCQPASRSVWNMSRSVKWTVYDNPSWVFFIFCWSGKGEWL